MRGDAGWRERGMGYAVTGKQCLFHETGPFACLGGPQYAALLAEKKSAYADYRKARDEMRELLTVSNRPLHRAVASFVLAARTAYSSRPCSVR